MILTVLCQHPAWELWRSWKLEHCCITLLGINIRQSVAIVLLILLRNFIVTLLIFPCATHVTEHLGNPTTTTIPRQQQMNHTLIWRSPSALSLTCIWTYHTETQDTDKRWMYPLHQVGYSHLEFGVDDAAQKMMSAQLQCSDFCQSGVLDR